MLFGDTNYIRNDTISTYPSTPSLDMYLFHYVLCNGKSLDYDLHTKLLQLPMLMILSQDQQHRLQATANLAAPMFGYYRLYAIFACVWNLNTCAGPWIVSCGGIKHFHVISNSGRVIKTRLEL